MFEVDGVTYEFHHLGFPTRTEREGERYSAAFGLYTSDDPCRLTRIQWHRFTLDSPLHLLLQTVPHPAFKVSDLDRAIAGKTVILGPYEPISGYRVAAIVDGGLAVELIQNALSDAQLWERVGQSSPLYPDDSLGQGDSANESGTVHAVHGE